MNRRRHPVDHRMVLQKELTRIVNKLRELDAEKVILFGSYAQGRADLFTDLDIIVVLDTDLPYVERSGYIYRELSPRVAADVLVYTPQEWQKMQGRPFIKQALKEGKVLYEKTFS